MAESSASPPPEKKDEKEPAQFLRVPVTIWVALIGLVTAAISGVIGHNVGVSQVPNQPPSVTTPPNPPPLDPRTPRPDVPETDIRVAMNQVRGGFDKPASGMTVGRTIPCSGFIKNFQPKMHLWLAVEVGGFIWFKGREIEPDLKHNSWSTSIEEFGQSPIISILLYVADEDANEEIKAWMKRGEDHNNNFEKIAFIRGTIRLEHLDGLHLVDKP